MAFVSNTARDAGPTIAGFFLQVNFSILRWLDINASQYLELECGEDIDTVEQNEENGAERNGWAIAVLFDGRFEHLLMADPLSCAPAYLMEGDGTLRFCSCEELNTERETRETWMRPDQYGRGMNTPIN